MSHMIPCIFPSRKILGHILFPYVHLYSCKKLKSHVLDYFIIAMKLGDEKKYIYIYTKLHPMINVVFVVEFCFFYL